MNCRTCQYFFITYDPQQPLGCKAYGIKSKQLPSIIVLNASSESCNFYKEKYFNQSVKKKSSKINKVTNHHGFNIKG